MLAYFCKACKFFYRKLELVRGSCPQCKGKVSPRLILGGQVIGGPTLL